jgi:short-subunit dehydrogenase involved in D-alanine esterification of teichoic acids
MVAEELAPLLYAAVGQLDSWILNVGSGLAARSMSAQPLLASSKAAQTSRRSQRIRGLRVQRARQRQGLSYGRFSCHASMTLRSI